MWVWQTLGHRQDLILFDRGMIVVDQQIKQAISAMEVVRVFSNEYKKNVNSEQTLVMREDCDCPQV